MMPTKNVSCKICFIGEGGVGKTSLIGRYVYDVFDDKYLTTIGTKITRKELILNYPKSNVRIKMDTMIWDIMGQKAFRGLLREAYFHGAKGIIGVCNLTDKESLAALDDWIESLNQVVGKIPMVLLANKNDLKDEILLTEDEVEAMAKSLSAQFFYTSAKTGENVTKAFLTIGREMVIKQLDLPFSLES
ncbi:MAG: GTP-binding protein [Methanomassiliicoccales archaeon]|nr:MAG: GTP-binding protein [Methanomassiliicoccales archaeon]